MRDDVDAIAEAIFGPGGAEDRELRIQAKSVAFNRRFAGLTKAAHLQIQPRGTAMSSVTSEMRMVLEQYYRVWPQMGRFRTTRTARPRISSLVVQLALM